MTNMDKRDIDATLESNRAIFLDQVEKRISFEVESRKASETRAIACITLNAAVATIYFALRTQLGLNYTIHEGLPHALLIIGTCLDVISVVVAVLAILPARTLRLNAQALRSIHESVNTQQPVAPITDAIIEARIEEFESLAKAATLKARFTLVALAIFAAAVVSFVGATALSSM